MTDYTEIRPNEEIYLTGLTYELNSLFAYLMRIKDPRQAKGKIYPLATLLVLILLAKLGGEDKPSGIVG